MRYSPNTYAQTFLSVTDNLSGEALESAIERFVVIIHKHGNERYFEKIIEALGRELTRKAGGQYVEMTFAREPEVDHVVTLRKLFSAHSHTETVIDPSLVAGVRIRIDDEEELDLSLQSSLNRLFEK